MKMKALASIFVTILLLQSVQAKIKDLPDASFLIEALQHPHKQIVVLFIAEEDWCTQCKSMESLYSTVAESFERDRMVVFYRYSGKDDEFLGKYTAGVPFVRVFTTTDRELGVAYTGNLDAMDLYDFIQKRVKSELAFPPIVSGGGGQKSVRLNPVQKQVVDLNQVNTKKLFSGKTPILMLVTSPDVVDSIAFEPKFEQIAQQIKAATAKSSSPKLITLKLDYSKQRDLVEKLSIVQFPTVLLMFPEQNKVMKFHGRLEIPNILNFVGFVLKIDVQGKPSDIPSSGHRPLQSQQELMDSVMAVPGRGAVLFLVSEWCVECDYIHEIMYDVEAYFAKESTFGVHIMDVTYVPEHMLARWGAMRMTDSPMLLFIPLEMKDVDSLHLFNDTASLEPVGIIRFVEKYIYERTQPPITFPIVKKVQSTDEIFKALTQGFTTLVLAIQADCMECTKARSSLMGALKQHPDVKMFYMVAPNLPRPSDGWFGPEKAMTFPSLVLLRNDDVKKYLSTSFDQEDIVAFIKMHNGSRISGGDTGEVVRIMTPTTLPSIMAEDRGVFIMFHATWCTHCNAVRGLWDLLGERFRNDPEVLVAKCDGGKYPSIAEQFDVDAYPSFKFIPAKNRTDVRDYTEGRDIHSLTEFTKMMIGRDQTERIDFSKNAIHIGGNGFVSWVVNETIHHNYVLWVGDNCPLCFTADSIWEVTAKILLPFQPNITFIRIDGSKNRYTAMTYGITKFPHIQYFPLNDKGSPVTYDGPIDRKNIVKFVKENTPYVGDFSLPVATASVSTDGATEIHSVEDVDRFFNAGVAQRVFVMFYAPWCGHCKSALPEFDATARILIDHVSNIDSQKTVLAKIDSTVYHVDGIDSYPIFRLYYPHKEHDEYEGARTREAFERYLFPSKPRPKYPVDGTVMDLRFGSYNEVVEDPAKHVLVMYYASWCKHSQQLEGPYKAVAKHFQDNQTFVIARIDVPQNPEIGRAVGISSFPTFLLHTKYDKDDPILYREKEEVSKDSLIRFATNWGYLTIGDLWATKLTRNRVINITSTEFGEIIRNGTTNLFVAFYAVWCDKCKKIKLPLEERADEYLDTDPSVRFVSVESGERDVITLYNVTKYPTMMFFPAGSQEPILYNQSLLASALGKFMNVHKRSPNYEDLIRKGTGAMTLSQRSWENEIGSGSHHSVVLFAADWCQYCQAFTPIYEILASQYHSSYSSKKVMFFRVDSTRERFLSEQNGVKGLPTVLVFKKGSKKQQLYVGDFTEGSVEEFIATSCGFVEPKQKKIETPKTPPKEESAQPHRDAEIDADGVETLSQKAFENFLSNRVKDGMILTSATSGPAPSYFVELTNALRPFKAEFTIARVVDRDNPNTLILYKGADRMIPYEFDSDAQLNSTLILQFLVKEGITVAGNFVKTLTSSSFADDVLGDRRSCFVMFYAPWDSQDKAVQFNMQRLSQELHGLQKEVFVAKLDIGTAQELKKKYEIQEFPTFLMFVAGKKDSPFSYQGPKEYKKVLEFVKGKIKDVKLAPEPKKEPERPKRNLVEFTQDTFLGNLTKKTNDILLAFIAPWSSHSQQLLQIIDEVIQNPVLDSLIPGHIDGELYQELSEKYNVEGYPTLLFFGYDQSAPVEIRGRPLDKYIITSHLERYVTQKVKKSKAKQEDIVVKEPFRLITWAQGTTELELRKTFHKGYNAVIGIVTSDVMDTEVITTLAKHVHDIVSEMKGKILVVTLPKDANPKLVESNQITWFPTYVFFPTMSVADMGLLTGPFTLDFIHRLVKGPLVDPPVLSSRDEFDKVAESENAVVVFHYKWSSHSTRFRPHVQRLGQVTELPWYVADLASPEIAPLEGKYNIGRVPAVLQFLKDKEPRKYTGYRAVPHLMQWITGTEGATLFDGIVPLTTVESLEEYVAQRPTIVMFVRSQCTLCDMVYGDFVTLAGMFSNNATFVIFDLSQLQEPEIRNSFALTTSLPTYHAYAPTEKPKLSTPLNAFKDTPKYFALYRWLSKLYVPQADPSVPPSIQSGTVITLNEDNFDAIALDTNRVVIVKMYAPWCGHCKALAPTWDELAKELSGQDVIVAKLDLTNSQKIGSRYGVGGIPHIHVFPKNKKDARKYEGPRELRSLLAFARNLL